MLIEDLKVNFVGCSTATDKIACLRKAPYEKLYQHQGTAGMQILYVVNSIADLMFGSQLLGLSQSFRHLDLAT